MLKRVQVGLSLREISLKLSEIFVTHCSRIIHKRVEMSNQQIKIQVKDVDSSNWRGRDRYTSTTSVTRKAIPCAEYISAINIQTTNINQLISINVNTKDKNECVQ